MVTVMVFFLSVAFSAEPKVEEDKVYDETMKRTQQEQYQRQKKMMEYRLKGELNRLKNEKKIDQEEP